VTSPINPAVTPSNDGGVPGRLVTLVVCDGGGEVLGETGPFLVATPWWQDVAPIQERFPSLAVLRLLKGNAKPHSPGAAVRYLAQVVSEPYDLPRRSLRPLQLPPGELDGEGGGFRMPWARAGGPAADLAWAHGVIRPTGPATQHRTWNLSAIWSFPTERARVWLKCVPPFMAHEAPVLAALQRKAVPRLVASDGHRMLLAEMPGRDGYEATRAEVCALIDGLVDLQVGTVPLARDFLSAGVPDARWPALLEQGRQLVDRRAPDHSELNRLLALSASRVIELEECGLPDMLVHGDAHPGNARVGCSPIWFDWGDSRVGNPVLDMAVLDRADKKDREALESHWLAAWASAVPGSDPVRAWALSRPLAALRCAGVYQGFLDRIEASERVYHDDDVEPGLRRACELIREAS
jgi:Phosphotransferase enzyme family